jgi:hypothetical protein
VRRRGANPGGSGERAKQTAKRHARRMCAPCPSWRTNEQ